jgi:hypothetical protein
LPGLRISSGFIPKIFAARQPLWLNQNLALAADKYHRTSSSLPNPLAQGILAGIFDLPYSHNLKVVINNKETYKFMDCPLLSP